MKAAGYIISDNFGMALIKNKPKSGTDAPKRKDPALGVSWNLRNFNR